MCVRVVVAFILFVCLCLFVSLVSFVSLYCVVILGWLGFVC